MPSNPEPWSNGLVTLHTGHVLAGLLGLPAESVQCRDGGRSATSRPLGHFDGWCQGCFLAKWED